MLDTALYQPVPAGPAVAVDGEPRAPGRDLQNRSNSTESAGRARSIRLDGGSCGVRSRATHPTPAAGGASSGLKTTERIRGRTDKGDRLRVLFSVSYMERPCVVKQ